jgi:hypothetical protein
MLFVKLFFEAYYQIVVLNWICNWQQFLRNQAIIKEIGDFWPIIESRLLETLSGIFHWFHWWKLISTLLRSVCRHSVVSVLRNSIFLFGLGYEVWIYFYLWCRNIIVFQESCVVTKNLVLNSFFNFLSLLNFLSFVNFTTFLNNTGFLIVNIDVDNIIFVELFGPSIWNSIFYLIFKLIDIGLFWKSLANTLFMQFIKLIIKLGNHMLYVLSLFLLIQFVNDCLFNVTLSVPRYNQTIGSNNQLGLDLTQNRLFSQNLFDWSIFVLLKHINVAVVYIVNSLLINFSNGWLTCKSKWSWPSFLSNHIYLLVSLGQVVTLTVKGVHTCAVDWTSLR